jgi:DNA-binding response OmpR family regulator
MKTMLIIDDDSDILEALEALLDLEGFDIRISTKADIIDKIKATQLPDMIIMDVLLSGEDGRDVVKRLKKETLTKQIPVLMISAHPNVRKSSLKAGANAFMAKPFETRDLVNKVHQLLHS